MRKLKAFTLFELLVAMTISSVLISMSYLTYSIVSKMFKNKQQQLETSVEIYKLYSLLDADFFNCIGITRKGNSFEFIYPDREVIYQLNSNEIIRTQDGNNDVFAIDGLRIELNALDTHGSQLIKDLSLEISKEKRNYPMTFIKQYGGDAFVNRDIQWH